MVDVTKEELTRVVEEMREEIQRVVRGAKDMLAGGDNWANIGMVEDHTPFRRPTSYAATLNTRLPSMHPNTLSRT